MAASTTLGIDRRTRRLVDAAVAEGEGEQVGGGHELEAVAPDAGEQRADPGGPQRADEPADVELVGERRVEQHRVQPAELGQVTETLDRRERRLLPFAAGQLAARREGRRPQRGLAILTHSPPTRPVRGDRRSVRPG
jgi:hypothetical protein